MKKMFVCLLAAMMIASFGVASYAAPAAATAQVKQFQASDTKNYSLKLSTSTIEFTKNGRSSSYDLGSGTITLTKSSSNGISVQFPLKAGTMKKITLGSQNTLTIDGSVDTLKLDSKLSKDAVITLDSKFSAKTLTVDAPCKVNLNGSADKINITEKDANVIVSDKATVSSVTTASKNAVSGVSDSKVTVSTKKATSTTKATTSTTDKDDKDKEEEDKKTPTISVSNLKYGDDFSVTFDCDVAGAAIVIDGRKLGETKDGSNSIDFVLDKDSKDSYTVYLTKEGYKDAEFRITFGGYYTNTEN